MTEENYQDDNTSTMSGLDFDLKDDYKPDPLHPDGTYHGVVTKVAYSPEQYCINWSICLQNNGGMMSDDETPIDGTYVFYTNWLPKPGDENLMTASGKNTKRQSKINMLADFADLMEIDMSTPAVIATSLDEAIWVGLEVDVTTMNEEYNGKFRTKVKLGGMRPTPIE